MKFDRGMRVFFLISLLASALALAATEAPSSGFTQISNLAAKPYEGSISDKGTLWNTIVAGLYKNPTIFCINPDPNVCKTTGGVNVITTQLIKIMVPFYVIAMMFCALFFILKSGTPRGRAASRSMFLKLVWGMILVALSPAFYQMMLDFEYLILLWLLPPSVVGGAAVTLPQSINFWLFQLRIPDTPFTNISLADMSPGTILGMMGSGCIISCCSFVVYIVAGILTWARNLLVFMYGVFFPMITFMYFFDLTKSYGRKYMQDAIKWIFMPAFQAFILVITLSVKRSLETINFSSLFATWGNFVEGTVINPIMATGTILAGMIGFIAAPMVIGQLMAWVGTAITTVGVTTGRTWLVAAGGVLSGGFSGGPAQIAWAHGQYSRTTAFDRMEAAAINAPGGRSYGGLAGSAGAVRPGVGGGGGRYAGLGGGDDSGSRGSAGGGGGGASAAGGGRGGSGSGGGYGGGGAGAGGGSGRGGGSGGRYSASGGAAAGGGGRYSSGGGYGQGAGRGYSGEEGSAASRAGSGGEGAGSRSSSEESFGVGGEGRAGRGGGRRSGAAAAGSETGASEGDEENRSSLGGFPTLGDEIDKAATEGQQKPHPKGLRRGVEGEGTEEDFLSIIRDEAKHVTQTVPSPEVPTPDAGTVEEKSVVMPGEVVEKPMKLVKGITSEPSEKPPVQPSSGGAEAAELGKWSSAQTEATISGAESQEQAGVEAAREQGNKDNEAANKQEQAGIDAINERARKRRKQQG